METLLSSGDMDTVKVYRVLYITEGFVYSTWFYRMCYKVNINDVILINFNPYHLKVQSILFQMISRLGGLIYFRIAQLIFS